MNLQDTKRLAVCWTKAQPVVAAFISSQIRDFHQAEDVLHQVAVILVKKFAAYDDSQPFVNWAIGIARLEILKHRRRFVTDKHRLADDLIELIGEAYEKVADELEERSQALRECLGEMRGRSLDALRLRYFENREPQQIATQLELPAGTVRVLLHRARIVLRKCVEQRILAQEGRS